MRPQIARSAGWPKELKAEGWETLDVLMENCENPMNSWEIQWTSRIFQELNGYYHWDDSQNQVIDYPSGLLGLWDIVGIIIILGESTEKYMGVVLKVHVRVFDCRRQGSNMRSHIFSFWLRGSIFFGKGPNESPIMPCLWKCCISGTSYVLYIIFTQICWSNLQSKTLHHVP